MYCLCCLLLFVNGCSLRAACCSSVFVVRCVLYVDVDCLSVCCLLFVGRRLLRVVRCMVTVARWLVFAGKRCLLFIGCCLLCAVKCLLPLFVVSCVSFVVCCLLSVACSCRSWCVICR